MKRNGMGSHEQTIGVNQEWLTPPDIIKSLGTFDLDPCAPVTRPWDTAIYHYTIEDDGLSKQWFDRVWLNPPYDRRVIELWMKRMAEHGNGITLIFARTETKAFQTYVFERADSVLFLEGRLRFYDVDGKAGKFTCGAPSALIAYGYKNVEAIGDSLIKGKHVLLNAAPIIIVGISPTWKSVVTIAMSRLGEADLQVIYEMVEQIAPDKIAVNQHYKEKIRQQLQYHFNRIKKGYYGTVLKTVKKGTIELLPKFENPELAFQLIEPIVQLKNQE